MKKKALIIGGVVLAVVLVVVLVMMLTSSEKTPVVEGVDFSTAEGLSSFITKVYEPLGEQIPMFATSTIDVTDTDSLAYYTGLTENTGIEFAVASEPMMSSQPYSLVLVKVAEDADLEKVKKDIFDKVDTRKWICVEADKKYATSYDNTIIFLMAGQEWVDVVYNRIKEVLGEALGEELSETLAEEAPMDEEVFSGEAFSGEVTE